MFSSVHGSIEIVHIHQEPMSLVNIMSKGELFTDVSSYIELHERTWTRCMDGHCKKEPGGPLSSTAPYECTFQLPDSVHKSRSPRPSPSVLPYYKQSNTGGSEE